MQTNSALSNYNDYGYTSEIEYANPHRLIQMLFEGALKRIACAKGAMQRKEIAEKGKFIGETIEIVGGLRASLDIKNGGEIAANLESLYEYINRQLVTANLKNSEEILNEVSSLLGEVKEAWDVMNDLPSDQAEQIVQSDDLADTKDKVDRTDGTVGKVEVKEHSQPVNPRARNAIKAYTE